MGWREELEEAAVKRIRTTTELLARETFLDEEIARQFAEMPDDVPAAVRHIRELAYEQGRNIGLMVKWFVILDEQRDGLEHAIQTLADRVARLEAAERP